MALSENETRAIVKEEVGDKLDYLVGEVGSLTKEFTELREEISASSDQIHSGLCKIMDHLGIKPGEGPS